MQSLGIYLQRRNCFCGLWLNKRIVFGELSKGDVVWYISYLGHMLERVILRGTALVGAIIGHDCPFRGARGVRSQTLEALCHHLSSLSRAGLLHSGPYEGTHVYVLLPRPHPLSWGSRAGPPSIPGTGDGLRGLPYLAARLCLQGALSTSETAYLLRPQSPQAAGEWSRSEFAG